MARGEERAAQVARGSVEGCEAPPPCGRAREATSVQVLGSVREGDGEGGRVVEKVTRSNEGRVWMGLQNRSTA